MAKGGTGKGKYPQRAPKRNYFKEMTKTPEGRALRAEWNKKAWANNGRTRGVPDGYTKETIAPIRAKAREEAEIIVSKIAPDEDEFATEALKTAVEVMRVPGETRERLAAARLVLDFTKTKPAAKQEVSINKAEDFLNSLLDEESKNEEETFRDTQTPLQ